VCVLVARKTQERKRQFWQRSRHNAGDVIVANLHRVLGELSLRGA
jgi:hypothetical protein